MHELQLRHTRLAVFVTLATAAPGCGGGDAGVPAPLEQPGATNTGPSDIARLREHRGSLRVTTEGAVVEDVSIQGGTLHIQAHRVTVRNFRIDAGGSPYGIHVDEGFRGHLFVDGEVVNASSKGILGGGFTARRLNIHHQGADAISPTTDVTVEQSWFHHLGMRDGSHADAVQSRWGGSNLVFRHNFCDIPVGLDGFNSNACFIFEPDGGSLSNVLVEQNWLNGGNYTVYCSGQGVTVRSNKFGRDFRYGLRNDCTDWTGNVWVETGAAAD